MLKQINKYLIGLIFCFISNHLKLTWNFLP